MTFSIHFPLPVTSRDPSLSSNDPYGVSDRMLAANQKLTESPTYPAKAVVTNDITSSPVPTTRPDCRSPTSTMFMSYLKVLSVWYADFSRRIVQVQPSSRSAAVAQRLMRASRFWHCNKRSVDNSRNHSSSREKTPGETHRRHTPRHGGAHGRSRPYQARTLIGWTKPAKQGFPAHPRSRHGLHDFDYLSRSEAFERAQNYTPDPPSARRRERRASPGSCRS